MRRGAHTGLDTMGTRTQTCVGICFYWDPTDGEQRLHHLQLESTEIRWHAQVHLDTHHYNTLGTAGYYKYWLTQGKTERHLPEVLIYKQPSPSQLSWLNASGRATWWRRESTTAAVVQSHADFLGVWVSVPFTTSDSKVWIIRYFIIITLCLPQEHSMGVVTAPTSFSSNVWANSLRPAFS